MKLKKPGFYNNFNNFGMEHNRFCLGTSELIICYLLFVICYLERKMLAKKPGFSSEGAIAPLETKQRNRVSRTVLDLKGRCWQRNPVSRLKERSHP